MATWDDVGTVARELPEVTPGQAHEGSPAYDVAGRQFARLRWDGDREILQFWTGDPGARQALVRAEPETFWVTKAFTAAVFGWLGRMSLDELREVVTDSWAARAPKRLCTRRT